jgi:predicted outer membrane protein
MKLFKISIAILSLVAGGFFAGFYTNRLLVQQEIRQVASMRSAQGLQESVYEKIQATPAQRTQIAPAVESYAARIATVHQESRAKRRALVDSLQVQIEPFLSAQQMQQLDNFCDRYYRYNQPKRQLVDNRLQ